MSKDIEAACADRATRMAITEDGQTLPITNMFDADGDECDDVDGDECDDVDDAVTCVAGPDKDGLWLSIDFSVMEKVTLQ